MRTLFILALSLFISNGAMAQSTPPPQSTGNVLRTVIFKEAEKRIIEDFLGVKVPITATTSIEEVEEEVDGGKKGKKGKKANKGKGRNKGLPPGLAKRRTLPPGLAKRQSLPPGLSMAKLPPELEAKLPPVQEGVERVVVDNNIVLIEEGTRLVLDVIQGVVNTAVK